MAIAYRAEYRIHATFVALKLDMGIPIVTWGGETVAYSEKFTEFSTGVTDP
jgi:hypothetical protein